MLSQAKICLTAGRSCSLSYNVFTKRWCTAAHTLEVKEKIEKTRDQALLGGGQKRIDKQHQKVKTKHISPCTGSRPQKKVRKEILLRWNSVADPGFPRGGGASPRGGRGANLLFVQFS